MRCLVCGCVFHRQRSVQRSVTDYQVTLAQKERDISILTEALQRIAANDQTATPGAIALTALARVMGLSETESQ